MNLSCARQRSSDFFTGAENLLCRAGNSVLLQRLHIWGPGRTSVVKVVEVKIFTLDHISARPDDLQSLVDGMIAFDHSAEEKLDAVIAAAVLAFGFVYIHPFEDRNGRIHRYLIHHVLARRAFPGIRSVS